MSESAGWPTVDEPSTSSYGGLLVLAVGLAEQAGKLLREEAQRCPFP